MAVADKFKSIIDFLTSGFNDREDSIYEEMMDSAEEYPVQDNLAREPIFKDESKAQSPKVVTHPNYRGYEVMVCEPRSYEDSISIVKHLKDRKTIVLNLHLLDREQALRIVDFLCGATHALSGSQQKIGDSVFIFTPVNVALSAESQKSKFLRDALWNQPQA
ncbi:cell division protein SepF [bacterium]|nr:cell division protein SepF [bacterium]